MPSSNYRIVWILLLLILAIPQFSDAQTYKSVGVDLTGQLRIVPVGARTVISPPKDSGQIAFGDPAISPDSAHVGWLALYSNCCTSYPIALKLVVLSREGRKSFKGTELAISKWRFEAGGNQVAFKQETVHGGMGTNYELGEVRSGRTVAVWEPGPGKTPPAWVRRLEAQH